MKIFLIILTTTLFISSTNLFCQEKDSIVFNTYHKNIYFELLGATLNYGLNFDMRLEKGKMDGMGLRAGVGGISASGRSDGTDITLGLITFPLEFNYLMGKRSSSFITGVGLLPVYATFSADGALTDYEFVSDDGFGFAGVFLNLGYRYQPKKNGIMFQASLNTLLLNGIGFKMFWFSLGLGYGFK